MLKPTVTEDVISRLRDERDAADQAYNEALTALDHALGALNQGAFAPAPLPAPDAHQVPRLNALWQVIPENPVPFTGWRAKLGGLAWAVMAPIAQKQQEFNSALVDHVNRTSASDHALRSALAEALTAVRRQFDTLGAFHARLIQYLQQVTLYVDTKDRLESGYLRSELEERVIALSAGLNGVSDELLKRWESAVSREQKFHARVTTVAGALDELRLTVTRLHYSSQALQRELERLAAAGPSGVRQGPLAGQAASASPSSPAPSGADLSARVEAGTYVGFEDAFRGAPEDIRAKQESYVPLFEGASDVLDIGCGRGEFLELLATRGITARGVDLNHEMVQVCRAKGLDVAEGDAVGYLEGLADESLGGIIALQVVEHLQPEQLLRFLALAHRKLRPGAKIVLETVNAACWFAFFTSYIRDFTHVRPLHPDTLRYLLVAHGFLKVEVKYSAPYPEQNKLQALALPASEVTPALGELLGTFNENVDKINALLFTHLDYAAIGEKVSNA